MMGIKHENRVETTTSTNGGVRNESHIIGNKSIVMKTATCENNKKRYMYTDVVHRH